MTAAAFLARYPFTADPFQVDATDLWQRGYSVVVAAPTGSGKTVVAEYAVSEALRQGRKAFYTTPLKALSNQKLGDFTAIYGPHRVGLLTGDNSVNPGAPLVVMTTEVLRNMIYEDSPRLEALDLVVLDEVHYLQDRYRGAVWEEVIIHLPPHVRLVCLSATVSNAEEFAEWVATLRGPTRAVVAAGRPVPLNQHLCLGDKRSDDLMLVPLNDPRLSRLESRGGPGGRPRRSQFFTPGRLDVVDLLEQRAMLPAIVFIFSRAGCDAAVQTGVRAGLRLTGAAEREEALARLDARVQGLSDDELAVLRYGPFREALGAGIAPHHAGMVPPFKEAVEECFAGGLIRLIFATETLSLGINMPARTVVIERLSKFTGDGHELLTAGQYTQLCGRAGRRGIDTVGHAVVLWSPWVPVERVAALATTESYLLTSSFRPDYNMAANLVRRYSRGEAEELLNSSFAQFRTDRDLVRVEANLLRRRRALDGYVEAARCERGDVEDYAALRAADHAARRARRGPGDEATARALMRARLGDVLWLPGKRGRTVGAVVSRSHSRGGDPRAVVVLREGRVARFVPRDLTGVPVRLGSIELPDQLPHGSAAFRKRVAEALRGFAEPARVDEAEAEEAVALSAGHRGHPVHDCPDRDRHLQFLARSEELAREIDRLDGRLRRRADALARQFDRVLEVMETFGYVDTAHWGLTARGETLASLYCECDLLVTEALAEGVFEGLDPPGLAALVSCLTFEPRMEDVGPPLPGGARLRESLHRLVAIWRELEAAERDRSLPVTREPHEGFADYAYRWARGETLEEVLADDELPGGDFVRQAKQVIDLLRQLAEVDESTPFAEAADRLERGVVAYTSI